MRLVPLLVALLACSSSDGEETLADPTDTDGASSPACDEVRSGVVTVTTRDGLALEADYLAPPACDAPGIVLVHMAPPNDRTNWPRSFRKALNEAGYAVLSIDRRGAGASEGNAADAPGPDGKYDVEAAVAKLAADGVGEVAILAASNGTAPMVDYAVWAPGEGLPEPFALGFMTGDTYTEAQTSMSQVPAVPAVFTYSTLERGWSQSQRTLHPGLWEFHEYPDGDHGTFMFTAAPEVEDDLLAFFVDAAG